MLSAYFDDGGTNGRQRIGVMAGFVAQIGDWEHFDVEWARVLGHPAVPYFRAHDCDKGDGVYTSTPEEERRRIYQQAVDVVCGANITPIAVAGLRPDFEGVWADQVARDPPEFIRNAFQLSSRMGFIALKILCDRRWPGEELGITCEAGTERDNLVTIGALEAVVDDPQWRELGVALPRRVKWGAKRSAYGLQAADLLAYELGKEFVRQREKPDTPSRTAWGSFAGLASRTGGLLRLSVREGPHSFGISHTIGDL